MIVGLTLASPAFAAGDAEAGHQLARLWCVSCHIVDRAGEGRDAAPPFTTIAAAHKRDHGWLRAWLTAPHPPMPDLHLTRQEIEDVIGYLETLSSP